MASSEKPDFIEFDQQEASVKLKTDSHSDAAPDEQSATASVGATAAKPATTVVSQLVVPEADLQTLSKDDPDIQFNPYIINDLLAVQRRGLLNGRTMRRLPFGSVTFIGLMLIICFFGNSIDEYRKRSLAEITSIFAAEKDGYAETVGDLADSYEFHKKKDEARKAYQKGLADLTLSSVDKGAKGAYLRLKMALFEFRQNNDEEADRLAMKALELIREGGTTVPPETAYLLHDLAEQYENGWNYESAIQLNLQALEVWPHNRPFYRSTVQAKIGFEYNRLKQFDKAETWLRKALDFSRSNGESRANIWRLAQLGQAQIGQKKYKEAEVNLKSALEMQISMFKTQETLHLGQIYADLGRLKVAQGNVPAAQKYFEDAAGIFKEGRYNPYYYLKNAFELANLYRDNGQAGKARLLYEELSRRLNDGEIGPPVKDVDREFDILRLQTGGK